MFKEIKKFWNTGNYQSKRELVEAFCELKGFNSVMPNKYELETLYVINRIANNVIQGGDGRFWKK